MQKHIENVPSFIISKIKLSIDFLTENLKSPLASRASPVSTPEGERLELGEKCFDDITGLA